jgi:hypothetical protein
VKENSISYKTAKRETERLIVELEERAITHRAFTAECLKRVLKENEELKVELERQKDINTIINQKGIDKNYEKALEKSMLKFLKTNMAKDFVSVQKVKDKIEELKQKKKKYGNCLIKMYEDELVNRDIKILQELLEGRK